MYIDEKVYDQVKDQEFICNVNEEDLIPDSLKHIFLDEPPPSELKKEGEENTTTK